MVIHRIGTRSGISVLALTLATSGVIAQELQWPGRSTLDWQNSPAAVAYNVYWGIDGNVERLIDASEDSCRLVSTAETSTNVTKRPGSGSYYWYLVRTDDGLGGEGTAGEGTDGPRSQNSTGDCGSGASCEDPFPIVADPLYVDRDTTCGAPSVVTDYNNVGSGGSCNSAPYLGPEVIYEVQLGAGNDLSATLEPSTADLGLFLLSDCATPTSCVAFTDAVGGGAAATITPGPLDPGTYYIYVDSYYASGDMSCGEYELQVGGVGTEINSCDTPLRVAALPFSDTRSTCGEATLVEDYNNFITGGNCNSQFYPGPELIYELQLGATNDISATLSPVAPADLGVFFISDCADPMSCVAFDDNPGGGALASITPGPLPAGTYYFYIDSYYSTGSASCGDFTLDVTGNGGVAAKASLVELRID